jgi:hypothetical protein
MTTKTMRDHFDTLMALHQSADDPELAAEILEELIELDRQAMVDPGFFHDLYGNAL